MIPITIHCHISLKKFVVKLVLRKNVSNMIILLKIIVTYVYMHLRVCVCYSLCPQGHEHVCAGIESYIFKILYEKNSKPRS